MTSTASGRNRETGLGTNRKRLAAMAIVLGATAAASPAGAGSAAPPGALVVPFAVDAEALAWAHRAVPERLGDAEKLHRLSRALLEPGGRPIAESLERTPTADEAWRERRANCVGYASLFVGLARGLGVPVYFALVGGRPSPTAPATRRELVVAEGHLAAGWGRGRSQRVFDLGGELPASGLAVEPITDLVAIAVFYSNRGVEALLDGDDLAAARWLEAAARFEPAALPSTWVNLGVARRRAGDLDGARDAYERALELDSAAVEVYRNLAVLLRLRGRDREAEELLAAVGQLATADPGEALELAQRRLLAGDLVEARGLYRKALELTQVDPER